jgi:hypothetical protein
VLDAYLLLQEGSQRGQHIQVQHMFGLDRHCQESFPLLFLGSFRAIQSCREQAHKLKLKLKLGVSAWLHRTWLFRSKQLFLGGTASTGSKQ